MFAEEGRGDEIVSRGIEQVEPSPLDGIAVAYDRAHGRGARFLRATEGFVLQRRNAPRLVSGGRVFIDRLTVATVSLYFIPLFVSRTFICRLLPKICLFAIKFPIFCSSFANIWSFQKRTIVL